MSQSQFHQPFRLIVCHDEHVEESVDHGLQDHQYHVHRVVNKVDGVYAENAEIGYPARQKEDVVKHNDNQSSGFASSAKYSRIN